MACAVFAGGGESQMAIVASFLLTKSCSLMETIMKMSATSIGEGKEGHKEQERQVGFAMIRLVGLAETEATIWLRNLVEAAPHSEM